MHGLRTFLRHHRRLAALLVIVALAMKALVPAGYMPGMQGQVLSVAICADASGGDMTRQIVLPADGKSTGEHGKAQGACPYAALGMAGLGGADTLLLALAIAFIIALGFTSVQAAPLARIARLRPPLRGPPALLTA